ncbi:SPASM domain-containing protein [Sphingobacterium sp. 2149]|uniref:SPASM domain-containing protein n=1 Tax=Sphingobacterium sp. 2149 TaxID=2817763 RepID=UPI001AE3EB5B|nr:SPASM domain-containing protein [Sphingobacterium sp. 2149]MDR6737419.1 uncharacterized protein [Sphingobacterium sp. 2149]
MRLSKYIITTSIEDAKETVTSKMTIIYSCLSNQTIVVRDEVFQKITNEDFYNLDERLITELQNSRILIQNGNDEFVELYDYDKVTNDNISLFVNLIESCRSGCNSCSKNNTISRPKNDFVNSINSYIETELIKKNLKTFFLTWKIDDPTEFIETMISISESNLRITDLNDIYYASSLICEGEFLTEKVFAMLFNLCIIKKYHITLQCSNYESTETTIKNILLILDNSPFRPQDGIIFELTIISDKINDVFNIIDKFSHAETQNRITFKFDFLENNDISNDELAENEIDCLFYAIEKGFIQSILPTRVNLPCAATDQNSLSVDKNGNLFSCNALPLSTPNIIENNLIGNVSDDVRIHLHSTKFRNWMLELRDNKPICYSCNLLPLCGGGCLLKREEGKSLGCPTFKYNIEDRLLVSYLNQKSSLNECIVSYYISIA